MDRMEEKGWLTHRLFGPAYFYSPLILREEILGQRVMDMVDKACGRKPEKLIMALINYRGLSNEKSKCIRKLLDDASKKK